MRYVLIDGSPEGTMSVTGDLIKRYLPQIRGQEYGILYARSDDHTNDALILNAADAVVLFSPVYNGGLPDQMLAFLSHLSAEAVRPLPAVVFLHTDIYDPHVCANAMAFMERWCRKVNWNLKLGCAVGGDRMLYRARTSEVGETMCARIDKAMASSIGDFARGKQENLYIRPPLPHFIYGQLAERWSRKTENETK